MIIRRQNTRASHYLQRFRQRNTRYLIACVSLTLIRLCWFRASSSKRLRLLIVILTAQRPESFSRLFESVRCARYGRENVDVLIHIDGVDERQLMLRDRTVKLARRLSWPHGEKTIIVENENIGLRKSWLSVSTGMAHTHVAILEDDMELSSEFYNFFKYVHASNYLSRGTALCLHPSDWELKVIAERKCRANEVPDVRFYFTPEPCNWGPIWSSTAWQHFKRWAIQLDTQPVTPAHVGFNYNKYLKLGKDVQSPWVWRYNWESSQVQLRYTLTCFGGPHSRKYHMAVNHREPGNNFVSPATQEFHDNLTSLLATGPLMNSTEQDIRSRPVEFQGYAKLTALLPPP